LPRRSVGSMWFADIYCDLAWVAERQGVLGQKRFALRGPKSVSLGISIEFHFFGDDYQIRHIRALMHTDDQHVAETCLNLNIQTWVAAIEVAVMLETKRPFEIHRIPGSQTFFVAVSSGNEDSPAAAFQPRFAEAENINYQNIAYAMAAWSGAVSEHLFYFRRLVDNNLPLDVRWLNGYRLLEWHFVGDKANLRKSKEWQAFVARFEASFRPLLRPNQPIVGLIEEARFLAAHAGMDKRSEAERARQPYNAMERTFRVLEQMVMTVLNEHPARAGSPIRFQPPEPFE
jgi:hypothetical protein